MSSFHLVKDDPVMIVGYILGRITGKILKHKVATGIIGFAITAGVQPAIPLAVTNTLVNYGAPWLVKVAEAHKVTSYIHPADYDYFDF